MHHNDLVIVKFPSMQLDVGHHQTLNKRLSRFLVLMFVFFEESVSLFSCSSCFFCFSSTELDFSSDPSVSLWDELSSSFVFSCSTVSGVFFLGCVSSLEILFVFTSLFTACSVPFSASTFFYLLQFL